MASLESAFRSAPFKFLVEGEPFYAHAELVSRHSDPLGALMKAPMEESKQGFAELSNVSAETFARFLEWIYQGFYTTPDPVPVLSDASDEEAVLGKDVPVPEVFPAPSEVVDIPEAPAEDDFRVGYMSSNGYISLKSKKRMMKAKEYDWVPFEAKIVESKNVREEMRKRFIDRKYTEFRSAVPIPPTRRNKDDNESYSNIFLCHAQLYVFAEMRLIPKLKQLALENLHETLKHFTLYQSRTHDIISLLRYVYEKTEERPGHMWEEEPIRALLLEYLGFEMDTLMDDEDFVDVIMEHKGALLRAFLNKVKRRI